MGLLGDTLTHELFAAPPATTFVLVFFKNNLTLTTQFIKTNFALFTPITFKVYL